MNLAVFYAKKRIRINFIIVFFLTLGFWFVQGPQKVNGAVLPAPIACSPGQYALMCPDSTLICPTTAHIQCESSIPFWARVGTCTVADGIPDVINTSATSYTPMAFCGMNSDTYVCASRQCPSGSMFSAMKASKGEVNGKTCIVRSARIDGSILQDQGKYQETGNECIKCGSMTIGGVLVNNLKLALCGAGGSFAIYLDPVTGNCNGGTPNVFSTACDTTVSTLCNEKSYLDDCGTCGLCDSNGQCVVGVGACVAKVPTVNITYASSSSAPGGTLTYNVEVTNNDRGNCTESFNLALAVPGGWVGNLSSTNVAPASCATQTVTFTVASPICATPGNYNVSVTATGNTSGLSATNSAPFNVLAGSLCTLTAIPGQIAAGGSSQLNWTAVAGISSAVINPGAINASPVAAGNVNVTPPTIIGTYTYNMDVTAACGTIANACSANIQVCAANWNQPCTSPKGCFSGTYNCSGTCVDGSGNPLADDSYYGSACQSTANVCRITNSGTRNCSNQCVDSGGVPITQPADPAGCSTTPDACGNFGTGFQCPAGCTAIAPPAPSTCTVSNACVSASGYLCGGVCNAVLPPSGCCGVTCNSPGACLTGPGTCAVDALGNPVCHYPTDPVPCDVDGNVCTQDQCVSADEGVTASCQAGINTCGGIVPCGRAVNNPVTPYDETNQCGLCHVFILLQIVSTFVFEIGGIVAVFFIVIGGLIYATSAGDNSRSELGKKAILWAVFGLIIIILSWLIVTIVLTAMGYINPLGGQWNIVNCSVS